MNTQKVKMIPETASWVFPVPEFYRKSTFPRGMHSFRACEGQIYYNTKRGWNKNFGQVRILEYVQIKRAQASIHGIKAIVTCVTGRFEKGKHVDSSQKQIQLTQRQLKQMLSTGRVRSRKAKIKHVGANVETMKLRKALR